MSKGVIEELRERVARVCNLVWERRLVTATEGNVSARVPKTNYIIIKPSGFHMRDVTPDSLIIVDVHGKVIEGKFKPSVETPMHTAVYRNRPDVGGVVHTHQVYATALGVAGVSIQPILLGLKLILGFPIVPYHLGGTQELADAVVRKLGKRRRGVVLQNHGILAVGSTVEDAFDTALYMEEAAKTQFIAMLAGKGRIRTLTKKEQTDVLERYGEKYLGIKKSEILSIIGKREAQKNERQMYHRT